MAINATQLLWYGPVNNVADSATYGDDIDTSASRVSNTANNVWDDVTSAQRNAGLTEYRKSFFRNENTDSYVAPKCWFSGDCNAPNTEIYMCKAGTRSQAGTATTLSQTATFVNGATTVWIDAALVTGELAVGEKIYNSTDDNLNYAVAVQSIGATYIYLWSNYLGTAGDAKEISVSSAASFASWVQPSSSGHADVLSFSDVAQNEYFQIWEKRVVTAGGAGANNATYSISVTDT